METRWRWRIRSATTLLLAALLASCNLPMFPTGPPTRSSQTESRQSESMAPTDSRQSESLPTVTESRLETSESSTVEADPTPTAKPTLTPRPSPSPVPTEAPYIDRDFRNMSEDDLMEYLLIQSMDVYELVFDYGYSLMVSGDQSQLPSGPGRDVWLGTDDEDKFTREFLFTIDERGDIYYYELNEDTWYIHATNAESFMAYIDDDFMVHDDSDDDEVTIYLDEVTWVDDHSAPNGYRILNPAKLWKSYLADLWTDCYVWLYVEEDNDMEIFSVSLDSFLMELLHRGEPMLVSVYLREDGTTIERIIEQYVP